MTTKQRSETAAELQAKLAELQRQIAALTQVESSVNSEAVASLTAKDWRTIRLNMVQHDRNNQPIFDREKNAYKLVKGADVKDYMFCRGFESTLIARANKGQPVELGTTVNPKTGYSQLMYATETIERLIAANFVKPDRFVKAEPKARKPRKSSK